MNGSLFIKITRLFIYYKILTKQPKYANYTKKMFLYKCEG